MTDVDPEIINLLHGATQEILELRRANAQLAPRAEAYERIGKLLDMVPDRSSWAVKEDVVQLIEKKLEELRPER